MQLPGLDDNNSRRPSIHRQLYTVDNRGQQSIPVDVNRYYQWMPWGKVRGARALLKDIPQYKFPVGIAFPSNINGHL